jgi:two-component system OmpR family sensor kinase
MTRLFWKFFWASLACQVLAIVVVVDAYGGLKVLLHPNVKQPLVPFFVAAVGGIATAALLAWYFAKPIRSLRSAFTVAASGDLDVHLDPVVLRRRDELAELGQHFNRMTGRLRDLIEGQRQLLHDVSHEMRSPLARMHAAIGLARRQPERLDAHLKRIELEAARMDTLVEELLMVARVQGGVGFEMKEQISLAELVTAVAEDCDFEARLAGGEVQLIAAASVSVRGNAELLHRALENVIRNAVKHGGAGRAVTVDLTGWDESDHVVLRVLDNGPGVPADYLEAIFEPFSRPPSPNRRSADGHGLGLTIARRIVEAHGGSIKAANRAEGGLELRIVLPRLAQLPELPRADHPGRVIDARS